MSCLHGRAVKHKQQPLQSFGVEPTKERVSKSAFEESNNNQQSLCHVTYQSEEVRNCDSWLNVQTKKEENTNQRGKIHVEKTTAQVLQAFLGFDRTDDKENRGTNIINVEEGMSADDRPLLKVFTDSSVNIETVSWFGAIA